MIMRSKIFCTLIFLGAMLCSCSDNNDSEKKEHVWSDQVRTIERAEEVEGMIMDSVELQKREIEEATQ